MNRYIKMHSRFVNEYRFEDGGQISGDYVFKGDNGITLGTGVLKGEGESTNLSFDGGKLKTDGDLLMESGVSSLDLTHTIKL
jgi:hypothetical protein